MQSEGNSIQTLVTTQIYTPIQSLCIRLLTDLFEFFNKMINKKNYRLESMIKEIYVHSKYFETKQNKKEIKEIMEQFFGCI